MSSAARYVFVTLAAVVALGGCSRRVADLSFASNRRALAVESVRGARPVTGVDCSHWLFFLPLGPMSPNLEEAFDRATDAVPGSDVLIDVRVYHDQLFLGIYNYSCLRIEAAATDLSTFALKASRKADRAKPTARRVSRSAADEANTGRELAPVTEYEPIPAPPVIEYEPVAPPPVATRRSPAPARREAVRTENESSRRLRRDLVEFERRTGVRLGEAEERRVESQAPPRVSPPPIPRARPVRRAAPAEAYEISPMLDAADDEGYGDEAGYEDYEDQGAYDDEPAIDLSRGAVSGAEGFDDDLRREGELDALGGERHLRRRSGVDALRRY